MTDRQAAEARERERTAELVRVGAAFQQARWMARQERLDDAEGENERLWDQADEIAALKSDRDALSVRLAQAEQNAGMCPVCEKWAGRGHGCEWCSEFAHESGWNDAHAELVAQAEQERADNDAKVVARIAERGDLHILGLPVDDLRAIYQLVGEWHRMGGRPSFIEEARERGRLEVRLREYEEARARELELVRRMAVFGPGKGTTAEEALSTIAAFVEKRAASGGREAPDTKTDDG